MSGQPKPVSTTLEQDSWYDPSGLSGTRTMRNRTAPGDSQYPPTIPWGPISLGGASSVDVTPIGGSADIHQSAKRGNLPMVMDILSRDPNLINASSRTGLSVLSSACESPRPYELVAHLVERGARVNDADMFYKRTALHVLCEKAGLSQDDWTRSTFYENATEQDVLATMRYLLKHRADVDARNCKQETPLMCLLIGRDCPRMVQILYSHGADSRLKSLEGELTHGTALCYAAYYGRIHSLEWMLENDLLSSDEENIKKAIQCATSSTAYPRAVPPRGNSRTKVMQMLEGWLGKAGVAKRARLANKISTHSMEDWWRRIAGGVADNDNQDNDDQDDDDDAGGIIGYPPGLRKTSRLAKSPPPLPPVRDIYKSSSTKMPLRMMPQGTLPQKKMPREMMPLGTMPQGVIPTKMTRMWHELQSLSRHLSQDRATDFDPAGEISPSQDNVWEIM
ncbi:ankyrin repeat-containing domain protein [Mortierella sp. GBAus27b]|nr:ankyrin repeat-containing domain protein [Mortierella sp. GBAus27b]